MSRRKDRKSDIERWLAEADEKAERFERWKDEVMDAAGYPDVSDDALDWLFNQEPDVERASLVLLARLFAQRFPEEKRE